MNNKTRCRLKLALIFLPIIYCICLFTVGLYQAYIYKGALVIFKPLEIIYFCALLSCCIIWGWAVMSYFRERFYKKTFVKKEIFPYLLEAIFILITLIHLTAILTGY